ncbi:MAG: HEAT repeat domain-containing protein [Planctomycetales bacterium]|nr:HEAT repeat domain-containing protein [Planctomycetales bacterium]
MRGALLATGLAAASAAACVTEVRLKNPSGPSTPIQAPPGESSEERLEKVREWIAGLALEGVKPESHRAQTEFLVRSLVLAGPLAVPALVSEGLAHTSAKVRENCAFVLGQIGDRRAEEPLVKLLDDPAETVRFGAAGSLVEGFQNKNGVPILFRALYHPDLHVRRQADYILREYTGQSFAFDPSEVKSARDFAAGKWAEWWRKSADTFVPRPR